MTNDWIEKAANEIFMNPSTFGRNTFASIIAKHAPKAQPTDTEWHDNKTLPVDGAVVEFDIPHLEEIFGIYRAETQAIHSSSSCKYLIHGIFRWRYAVAPVVPVDTTKRKQAEIQNNRRTSMKKLVEVDLEEGLEKLLGKRITLFCCRYIYTGTLAGVNSTCVLLKDPAIVYETGEFTTKDWKDAQSLPHDWYVQTTSIESFGELK